MTESTSEIVRVAVHGATGTQGSHIAARLTAAGFAVHPLNSRNVDLTDVESVSRAYADVDAVVVQLPLVFEPVAARYSETVLAALSKAGIRRAAFNPGMPTPPEPIGVPHVDARVALARQLPDAVENASVVGPATLYLENLVQPWSLRRVAERGEIAYPLPVGVPVPWLALDDLGDAIAAALRAERPAPTTLLTGPEAMTGDRVAATVAAAADRPVRWVTVPPAEYRNLITPMIGASAAAGVAAIYEQAPPSPPPVDTVRPAPTTVADWAQRQSW